MRFRSRRCEPSVIAIGSAPNPTDKEALKCEHKESICTCPTVLSLPLLFAFSSPIFIHRATTSKRKWKKKRKKTTTKRRRLRRSDQGSCERVLRAARRVVARLSIKRYSRDWVKNEGVKSNGPGKESYALARCLCKRIPPRVTLFASMLRFFLENSVDSPRSSSMAKVWFMGEKSRWK